MAVGTKDDKNHLLIENSILNKLKSENNNLEIISSFHREKLNTIFQKII